MFTSIRSSIVSSLGLIGLLWTLAAGLDATPQPTFTRETHTLDSVTPGVKLALREVRMEESTRPRKEAATAAMPVLLVHGGGPGAIGFDLPVPGASIAEAVARAGHIVYLLDIRGWGGSSKPAALDGPVDAAPPAVSSAEASDDVGAAVRWIQARTHQRVALIGWASGGHWSGMYAARPEAARTVSHLVMLNSLYGVNAPWSLASACTNSAQPIGAYRLATRQSLLGRWDTSIPGDDKTAWRDPRVADAYVDTTLATDPTSPTRTPPSARIPYGYLLDACRMSTGHTFWHAADIRVPTLVIRGSRDFWSRPEDLTALEAQLRHAPRKRLVTIPEGTHHLLFDRPDHGRTQFLTELFAFLRP